MSKTKFKFLKKSFLILALMLGLLLIPQISNRVFKAEDPTTVDVTYVVEEGNQFVMTYFVGSKAQNIQLGNQNGKKFVKWQYKDSQDTLQDYNFETPLGTTPLTLYAKWEAITYILELHYGATDPYELTVTYGEELVLPEAVNKEGYYIEGWYEDEELQNRIPTSQLTSLDVAERKAVYANYQKQTYLAIFRWYGGAQVKRIQYGDPIVAPDLALDHKQGHTFKGFGLGENPTMPASNMIYDAVYEINQYTVKFLNDKGGVLFDQKMNFGSFPQVDTPTSQETDTDNFIYIFKGWDKPIAHVTEDVTYTAQYDHIGKIQSIEVEIDGVKYVYEMPYGIDINNHLTPDEPVKEGFTFAGWEDQHGNLIEDESLLTDPTIKIKARFTKNTYDLSLTGALTAEQDDVSVSAGTDVLNHGSKLVITLPTFDSQTHTRTFTVSIGGEPVQEPVIDNNTYTIASITGDVVAAVSVDAIPVEVTFVANEGTPAPESPVTIDAGQTISEPGAMTRTGYTFRHWAVLGDEETAFVWSTQLYEDVTLVAVWDLNKYDLTLTGELTAKQDNQAVLQGTEVLKHFSTLEITLPTFDSQTHTRTFTVSIGGVAVQSPEIINNKYTIPSITGDVVAAVSVDAIPVEVTFVANEGTPAPAKQNINAGETASEPEAMTRTGYNFLGWFRGEEQTAFVFSTPLYEDTTLTAKWEAKTYKLTLTGDLSATLAGEPISAGDNVLVHDKVLVITLPTFNSQTQTRTFTVSIGGVPVETPVIDNNTYTVTVSGAVVAAVSVDAIPVEVTFVANEGTPAPESPVTIDAGETISEPGVMTRTGYTFRHWAVLGNENTAFVFSTQLYEDVTLVAVWDLNKYDLALTSNLTATQDTQAVEPGTGVLKHFSTLVITLPDFNPTTHTREFKVNNQKVDIADDASTHTMTVGGHVSASLEVLPKQVQVQFNANGGQPPLQVATVNVGDKVTKPADPEKTGYDFLGWFLGAAVQSFDFENTTITENITLDAKWQKQTFLLTLPADVEAKVNGQLVLSGAYIEYGSELQLTIVEEGVVLGYATAVLKVNNEEVEYNAQFTHTISSVTKAITVTLDVTPQLPVSYQFNLNGGSGVGLDESVHTVDYGYSLNQPAEPVKTGYQFTGWTIDNNPVTFPRQVKSVIVIVANYAINEYTVTYNNANLNITGFNINGKVDHGSEITIKGQEGVTVKTVQVLAADNSVLATFEQGVSGVDFATGVQYEVTQNVKVVGTYELPAGPTTYTLTLPATGVTANPQAVSYDANTLIELTVTLNDDERIVSFKVGGVEHKDDLVNNKYSFNILSNTIVTLEVETVYTVTLDSGLSSSDPYQNVPSGSVVNITITVPDNKEVDEFKVDGSTINLEGATTYKLTVTANHNVTVTFKFVEYEITWKNDEGTLLQTSQVAHGNVPTYPGAEDPTKVQTEQYTYTFAGWSDSQGGAVVSPLPQATANATYFAVFTPVTRTYDVTVSGDGWQASPSVASPVAYNTDVTFTFEKAGYELTTLTVDGTSVLDQLEANGSYILNVTKAHQVVVGWTKLDATLTFAMTAPANTPVNADIYVIGVFPGLEYAATPSLPTHQWNNFTDTYKMVRQTDGTYKLNVVIPAENVGTYQIKYKYVIVLPGDNKIWESYSDPANENNRVHTVTATTTLNDIVSSWDGTVVPYTVTLGDNLSSSDLLVDIAVGTVVNIAIDVPANKQVNEFKVDGGEAIDLQGATSYALTVSGNHSVTVTFKDIEYTITWKDDEGGLLQTSQVAHGNVPTYPDGTPTKDATAQYTYTFAGWATTQGGVVVSPLPQATGPATYFAVFTPTTRTYDVTVEGVGYTANPSTLTGREYDSTITFTFSNPGYNLTGLTLDGNSVLGNVENDQYVLTVKKAHALVITWTEIQQDITVTFSATAPDETPANGDIYMIGVFPGLTGEEQWNNWTDTYKMVKQTDGTYKLDVVVPASYGTTYELKYKYQLVLPNDTKIWEVSGDRSHVASATATVSQTISAWENLRTITFQVTLPTMPEGAVPYIIGDLPGLVQADPVSEPYHKWNNYTDQYKLVYDAELSKYVVKVHGLDNYDMYYKFVYVLDGNVVWETDKEGFGAPNRHYNINGSWTSEVTDVSWPAPPATTYTPTINTTEGLTTNPSSLENITENSNLVITFTKDVDLLKTFTVDGNDKKGSIQNEQFTLQVTANHTIVVEWYGNIQAARNATAGEVVTIVGIVTDIQGDNSVVQDDSAGISIYLGQPSGLVAGDKVKVTGTRGAFGNLVQLSDTTEYVILSSNNELPAAVALDNLDNAIDYMSKRFTFAPELTFVRKEQSGRNIVVKYGEVELKLRADATSGLIFDKLNTIDHKVQLNGVHVMSWYNGAQLFIDDIDSFTVVPMTDAEKLAVIKTYLVDTYNNESYNSGTTVNLPSTHPTLGGLIEWSYDPTGAVDGDNKWVAVGNETIEVTATASIVIGGASGNQAVAINVIYVPAGSEVEQEIYSTGFESSEGFVASTSYNNSTAKLTGPTGQQWSTVNGTPSTTAPITPGQSMQMRWYSGNSYEIYTKTDFNLVKISKVIFKAKNQGAINVIVSVSKDGGTTWESPETFTLSTTATQYTYNVDASLRTDQMRIKFTYAGEVGSSRLYIDDVQIYGMVGASTPLTDAEKVAADKATLDISPLTITDATQSITLPGTGENGSSISWVSGNTEILNHNGTVVALPTTLTNVTLTATIESGLESDTKEFVVAVHPESTTPPEGALSATLSGSEMSTSLGTTDNTSLNDGTSYTGTPSFDYATGLGLDTSIFDVEFSRNSSNAWAANGGVLRGYYNNAGGGSITISVVSGYQITGIVINLKGANKAGDNALLVNNVNFAFNIPVAASGTASVIVDSLTTTSVTVQCNHTNRMYIESIEITYETTTP
jgi:uncharacterized repeat protein (TIGR02543 family)